MALGGLADDLGQSARHAMATGRTEEAARLWHQLAQREPQNAEALLHLGQISLQKKDFAAALQLLERARAAAPADPVISLNLAFLFRATGDAGRELAALTDALSIDPYFYPALLSRGMLEERQGDARAAAATYRNLLKTVASPDLIPAPFRSAWKHAEDVVREDAVALDAFLQSRIDSLRARHPAQDWNTLAHWKEIAAGNRKVYHPEPAMLHIPYLPSLQFYDNAAFAWLPALEAAAGTIREEFLKVFREDNREGFRPYINRPADVPLNQWAELNSNPKWSVFSLWQDGNFVEANGARCPRTVEILRNLPMCEIPNFAPNVVFSLLAPHTTIPAHSGDTNARLIVHLPLIVPPNCRFRVGNDLREWREGKAWVFDDTINHEAWNDSDELRVILMIDVWNPHLSVAERELTAELLNGVSDYRQGKGKA
ncbi:MAG: aspartyl/asparaginyl beta-hydroxylase domain-containing protein [Proteobacteria bacterium]|nr:aspartyl/asparaginyl beta-hydroxylase domain-containing protein [Pseudomonadota bacterium]